MHSHQKVRRVIWLLSSVLVATPAGANVIAHWNAVAADTITAGGFPAVTAEERRSIYSTDLATVHVAIYDAVNAIVGGYEPYAAVPTVPTAGASPDAAAGAATCRVLAGLFPNRGPRYATPCANFQATSPGSDAHTRGVAVGIEVANVILALRANDGRSTNVTYVPGNEPGDFSPFPVGSTPANLFGPFVRPFAIRSASQFRPAGPPALDSPEYAEDFNQVKSLGAAGSVVRTAEQEEIARFHTEPPPFFWPRNLRRFLTDDISTADSARFAALLWIAHADATLACFEAKYHYNFWRPRAAIPAADTDGNPETIADPAWLPVVPTPNHPEYPAAHACAAGATAESVSDFFGTKKRPFFFDSTVTGMQHPFDSTDDMVKEIQYARVYGGMHYRTSTVHGAVLGRKVAQWVDKHYFRPVTNNR